LRKPRKRTSFVVRAWRTKARTRRPYHNPLTKDLVLKSARGIPFSASEESSYPANYAGLYPLGNLVAPENQLAQIRTVRANSVRNSGKAMVKIGGPGGIRTRDLPDFRLKLANRTFFGPRLRYTRLNYRPTFSRPTASNL